MVDRLAAGIRHRFYTTNIVVEYTTTGEDPLNGVDATLPTGNQDERTLTLADGTTIVGVLQANLGNLHPDNTEVAPAYVQKVGLYAEYFLTQWLNAPYLVRDPRVPQQTGRVEYRVLTIGTTGAIHGLTHSGWDFIKIAPTLTNEELPDDVPHEIVHRIQFLYNPLMKDSLADDAVGIYGIVREGGAVFCTENLNGALNRYAFQAIFALRRPQNYSLTVYQDAHNYAAGLLWKYIAERHSANAGAGVPSAIEEFETYRLVLEQTATLGPSPPGLGYTVDALRNALLSMPVPGQWDSFRYLDSARTELDSHETTWGNYLLANHLHGSAHPVADIRFDYLEDDAPVEWLKCLPSPPAPPPPPPALLSEMGDGVDATSNQFEIGVDDYAHASRTVNPWSAWYYRVLPKATSLPRMIVVDVRALSNFNDPLVQIIKLGPGKTLQDIHRSDSKSYSKTLNMSGVGEIVVIVAGRDTGGIFELDLMEVASAADVMCTRWNTQEGREYEVDPRKDAWTWLSPDIMVGNDVVGNADGTVFAARDNELRVRLRNKGNIAASNIRIHLWCRLDPTGAWQPVKNSRGEVQERTNEYLAADDEAWFDMVWAPAPLSTPSGDIWTVKMEVEVPGDPNKDNKIVLSRFVARRFILPLPSRIWQVFRWLIHLFSFGLLPVVPEPFPPEPVPPDPPLYPSRQVRRLNDFNPLTLPPGLSGDSVVTLVQVVDRGIVGGVSYALAQDQGPFGDALQRLSGLTCRLARQDSLPGKVVRWMRRQSMKTLTWQMVSTLGIVVAGLTVVYVATDDQATRTQLIGFFDKLVPFVVGAASGSAIAGTTGFLKGRRLL